MAPRERKSAYKDELSERDWNRMLDSGLERDEFVAREAERKRKLEERRERAAEAEEDEEEPPPPNLSSVPPRKRGKKEAEHQAAAAAAAAAAVSKPGKPGKAKAGGGGRGAAAASAAAGENGGGGKRRRESGGSSADGGGGGGSGGGGGGGGRAGKPPKLSDTPHRESLRKVLNAVANCSERARKIAQLFLRLPADAEAPGYYTAVARPISIAQMRERLGTEPDYSFAKLDADMDLMVANAHVYNDPASQVFVDANTLLAKYHEAKAKYAQGAA